MQDLVHPGTRRLSVFDTTLRDGEQAPRNALNPDQKLDLALRLEAMGVDVIESGFPASSPSDHLATRLIAERLSTARIATFCRATRGDVDASADAAGVDNHQLQILATGSEIHLEHKRGITRQAALEEVRDTVAYAKALGIGNITVAMEDATRGSRDLIRATVETSLEAGAEHVAVGDTTGCATPAEFGDLVRAVREWAPRPLRVSVHCHNDFGLATANTLAGIAAGADEVQVTLGGIGERAGNTAMEEIVALLAYKSGELGVHTEVKTELMYAAYEALRAAIGLERSRNKALFGEFAFATAAGIHQRGMLQNPITYEYVEPGRFGRESRMLVARHSGRAILRHVLREAGIEVDNELLAELFARFVNDRASGDCVELAELRKEILRELAPAVGEAR